MPEFIRALFSNDFMPHGYCLGWDPALLWLLVISNLVIAIAYYSIPVALIYFVRRRRDLAFSWMFCMFGAFICACGTTHLMQIWTIWHPNYWLEGSVEAFTAAISAVTALLLWPLIPKALAIPSPKQLAEKNQELKGEIAQRTHTEQNLRESQERVQRLNQELEQRVQELSAARDQAMEASKLKSQFVANISHELRTPLSGVLGVSELLMHSDLNREQRELIETLQSSATSLLQIINELLDFSKIEAGKIELESVPFSPLAIIEDCAEILAQSARKKSIALTTYIDPTMPEPLIGDPLRLRQILLNLASNAIKFTESGEVVIRVVMLSNTRDRVILNFSVTDSGIGIAQDKLGKLFQPFVQADGSSTRRHGGTGLGLSICKRLVELMQGDIGVESVPDKGSTFWFSVPLEKTETSADCIPSLPRLTGARVLIVNAPYHCAETLQSYCSNWGVECDVSPSLDAAVALTLERSGVHLPYHAWILVADPVKQTKPVIADLSERHELQGLHLIVLCTTDAEGTLLPRQCRDKGRDVSVLTWPIKQQVLYSCLSTAIQGKAYISAQAAAPAASAVAPRAGRSGEEAMILIVDDNPVNQRIAFLQIRQLGLNAQIASNGREAVDAVATRQFELILMDCQMPELDGFEATRLIRRIDAARGAHTPICAMTAHAMQGDRERCLAAGMDDYLSKPVSLHRLREILARWVAVPRGAEA